MLQYIIKDLSEFSDKELSDSFTYMNPTRKEKVLRYKSIAQKRATLAGELSVRRLLEQICGKHPDTYNIIADQNGKLKVMELNNLFFNISHSETKIAVAVSDEEVGIDIEVIRPTHLKLAKRICNDLELAYIFGNIPNDNDYKDTEESIVSRRFLEIWTAKEAYFKCIGTGITDLGKMKSLSTDFNKIKILTDEYVAHIVKISDI